MNKYLTLLLILLPTTLFAQMISKEQLSAQNELSVATDAGIVYENQAVETFWGDSSFMPTCIPEGTELPEAIDIYFVINKSGSSVNIYYFPNNHITACIHRYVKDRHFQQTAKNFTAHINLRFTQ